MDNMKDHLSDEEHHDSAENNRDAMTFKSLHTTIALIKLKSVLLSTQQQKQMNLYLAVVRTFRSPKNSRNHQTQDFMHMYIIHEP